MKKFIAITVLALIVLPLASASAATWSSLTITNVNSAELVNVIEVSATTGGNSTVGNHGTNNISGMGSSDGNSATGGSGGLIETGDATVVIEVINLIGSNDTGVQPNNVDSSETVIENINIASLANLISASVDTGLNSTLGGGGTNLVAGSSSSSWTGQNNAQGGYGGTIRTGNSATGISITNLLNSNITRITK
jgi:hypothetical protein